MRHLDLFSGIGGFSLAARTVGGIQTTQFVELDPDAQQVLRSQFPGIPIHSDIRNYTPKRGEFDLISMGFPCVGTSKAGTRTGLSHPESALWREGLRCVLDADPKFCIIEQPEGIIYRGLRTILGYLHLAGYSTELEFVSASSLGAGHQRLRLFIISYPDKWQKQLLNAPCWADQMREMVQRQAACNQWLTVKRPRDSAHHGISEPLVQLSTPNRTPGRIKARYLAGRSVTPGQAAVPLSRVVYLNSLTRE